MILNNGLTPDLIMNSETNPNQALTSRRDFLPPSAKAVAGAAVAGAVARPGYTSEDNTVKIALIGCGGRGTGAAAQALSTKGPTQLWAAADVFEHRVESSLKNISAQHGSQVAVPPERRFIGVDAYKEAMATLR